MHATLTWNETAVRLAWTLVAGVLVGLDRGEGKHRAGMRTNVLVCLAAALSMLLANELLPVGGKRPDSFSVMDTLRLPLGILSGMGFIGAGAILRRGDLVLGVTTAATLWMVTVLGLCFGGGAIGVGAAGLVLTLLTLWGLKLVEKRMPHENRGLLRVVSRGDALAEELRGLLRAHGLQVRGWTVETARDGHPGERMAVECEVLWRSREMSHEPPALVKQLRQRADLEELRWRG